MSDDRPLEAGLVSSSIAAEVCFSNWYLCHTILMYCHNNKSKWVYNLLHFVVVLRSKVYIPLSESAKYVNYFTKIREIVQNACYCLFSTDMIEIFHIKDVYI